MDLGMIALIPSLILLVLGGKAQQLGECFFRLNKSNDGQRPMSQFIPVA